jgi:hypothetical protein
MTERRIDDLYGFRPNRAVEAAKHRRKLTRTIPALRRAIGAQPLVQPQLEPERSTA